VAHLIPWSVDKFAPVALSFFLQNQKGSHKLNGRRSSHRFYAPPSFEKIEGSIMKGTEVLKGKKILVADDEEDLREIVVSELELYGAEAIDARDAGDAKEKLGSYAADAVISDIRMPGGGGIGLLDYVRQDLKKNIPVVLITGFADISREEALEKGAEAVFSKPIDWDQLIAAVARALKPVATVWAESPEVEAKREVSLDYSSKDEAIKARAIGFGRRGFFMKMEQDFPNIGDVLRFNFNFGTEVVSCLGMIQWIRREQAGELQSGIGVEVISVEDDHLATFQGWVPSDDGAATIPRS
jgi:CheY-like chemotaxis protein